VNQVELLQGELAGLSLRMKRIEVIFQSRGILSQDTADAEAVAEQMGFQIEVIFLPQHSGTKKLAKQRRELARRLQREKKWSGERIARALNCTERSVRRWLA
jgi:hypothetical protein